jgi:hypothetical protein
MAFSVAVLRYCTKHQFHAQEPPHLSAISPKASEFPRRRPLLHLMSSALVTTELRGFLLTRNWRDLPDRTEIEYWLATGEGPKKVLMTRQTSVAFLPDCHRVAAQAPLASVQGLEVRELDLKTFGQEPVLGIYARKFRDLGTADLVVVLAPGGDGLPGLHQCLEPLLVEALVPELSIEALDVAVLHGSPRLDQDVADAAWVCAQPMNALLVKSGPLSLRTASG